MAFTDSKIAGREHVDADQRQVALRRRAASPPAAPRAAAVELGDAERLGVGDLREQDLASRGCRPELVDQLGDAVAQQVVAEVHDEGRRRRGTPRRSAPRGRDRAGPPAGCRSPQMPEARAVPDRGVDLGLGVADDDADLGRCRPRASPRGRRRAPGLLATGTSCLALVWVMGRRRVPAPPESTSPLRAADTPEATSHGMAAGPGGTPATIRAVNRTSGWRGGPTGARTSTPSSWPTGPGARASGYRSASRP